MGALREVFAPSKEEVWRKLCAEIDAEYIKGGMWKVDKLRAQIKQWTVTLDSGTDEDTSWTRMRAPYVNADGFRFLIYRKSCFTKYAKLLGLQDIEIGDKWFDDEFVIQSNNRSKVNQFFSNSRIRELLRRQPSVSLSIKDDEGYFGESFPDGVDELYFFADGEMKNLERLKELYELFAESLNQLCHIGSAYEDDPKLKL